MQDETEQQRNVIPRTNTTKPKPRKAKASKKVKSPPVKKGKITKSKRKCKEVIAPKKCFKKNC